MVLFMTQISLQIIIENTDNDIVVWSYRNNYTAHHNPNMYSWLDVDDDGNVNKVNVKKFPYGSNPVDVCYSGDYVL